MDIIHFGKALEKLKERPHVYLENESYDELTALIVGMHMYQFEISGESILKSFHSWLQKNVDKCFSITSFEYILKYLAQSNEVKAKEILFEKLSEFVNESQ